MAPGMYSNRIGVETCAGAEGHTPTGHDKGTLVGSADTAGEDRWHRILVGVLAATAVTTSTVTTSTTTTTSTISTTSSTSSTSSTTSRTSSTTSSTSSTTNTTTITTTVVAGSMTISASNPEQFVSDPQARTAMREGIADLAGIPSSYVVIDLSIVRRLALWAGRHLQSGSIRVDYEISLPSESGTGADNPATTSGSSIAATLATRSPDDMTASLSNALNELDSGAYTIEVLEVSEPVVEIRTEQVPMVVAGTNSTQMSPRGMTRAASTAASSDTAILVAIFVCGISIVYLCLGTALFVFASRSGNLQALWQNANKYNELEKNAGQQNNYDVSLNPIITEVASDATRANAAAEIDEFTADMQEENPMMAMRLQFVELAESLPVRGTRREEPVHQSLPPFSNDENQVDGVTFDGPRARSESGASSATIGQQARSESRASSAAIGQESAPSRASEGEWRSLRVQSRDGDLPMQPQVAPVPEAAAAASALQLDQSWSRADVAAESDEFGHARREPNDDHVDAVRD
eukprot:gnl/TRDRNA2_/TRDRNA2_88185_c0_seq1.p1 gnl/TRDRNA2_/TRDRNA2_88185_c0~~gnl/TRDRNA2_/TRDRNA2_88185_c0_seq1.p1  ORF type:complete len:598 (+),score=82.23 gnl/TRDRNA2_/TRDRNA2_88185_c0_seq1:230-1795(+)